jgi:hypothetical protein
VARFGAGLRVYLNSMPLQWTRRRRQKEGGGEAGAQGETREVLLVGRDYAFVFENGSGKSTVEIGRLEILRSVGGDHLADGAMLLDGAKRRAPRHPPCSDGEGSGIGGTRIGFKGAARRFFF